MANIKKIGLTKKSEHLRLASFSIARGMRIGAYHSSYTGRGIDFAGVRQYLNGDDVRSIDWNVTARVGKPYVKLYEEEKEIIVYVLVDRSLSMSASSQGLSKMERACEGAALILFSSLQNNNPFGGILFNSEIEYAVPPQNNKEDAMRFFYALDTLTEGSFAGTALKKALRATTHRLKNRSLILIFSDFRCKNYEKELAQLSKKHDVVAVRFIDHFDKELPHAGLLNFVDAESNISVSIPTSSQKVRDEWEIRSKKGCQKWEKMCLKRGVSPLFIDEDDDIRCILSHFFSHRELYRG